MSTPIRTVGAVEELFEASLQVNVYWRRIFRKQPLNHVRPLIADRACHAISPAFLANRSIYEEGGPERIKRGEWRSVWMLLFARFRDDRLTGVGVGDMKRTNGCKKKER